MKTSVEISGLKELDRALDALTSKVRKQVIRKGLRAGAKIVLEEAKKNAPKRTGKLAKSFTIGGGRSRNGIISVRVQVGKEWFKGNQFYAGFQEFGWQTGKRGKLAKRGRHVPGKHFVAAAFNAKAAQATKVIIQTIREEMEKAIVKAARGHE